MTKEDKQLLLQELEKEGVKFLPWIGDKYDEGIYYDEKGELQYGSDGSGKGKKVLVLGESFYWDEEDDEDETSEENDNASSYFVSDLIEQIISENHDFNVRTFSRFKNAMCYNKNKDVSIIKFWEHLIFYDYVQEPLIYPRLSPTEKQFSDSETSFWKVIDICKPDVLIAWGMRLYNHLPPEGEPGSDFVETWMYKDNIKVIPIIHPAAPIFSTEKIFNTLKATL